jgi:hypothetical protein
MEEKEEKEQDDDDRRHGVEVGGRCQHLPPYANERTVNQNDFLNPHGAGCSNPIPKVHVERCRPWLEHVIHAKKP